MPKNTQNKSTSVCEKLLNRRKREPRFRRGDRVICTNGSDYVARNLSEATGRVIRPNVSVASTNWLMNGEYGLGSKVQFDRPLGHFRNWREKRYYTSPVYVPNQHLKKIGEED